jgi:hypothetical protein
VNRIVKSPYLNIEIVYLPKCYLLNGNSRQSIGFLYRRARQSFNPNFELRSGGPNGQDEVNMGLLCGSPVIFVMNEREHIPLGAQRFHLGHHIQQNEIIRSDLKDN